MTLRLHHCILGGALFSACQQPGSSTDSSEQDSTGGEEEEAGDELDTGGSPQSGEGRIVFHRYSSYDAWDSVLLMVDLADHSLTEISEDWDIDHAMNAHFSPDGSLLVFMGDQRGGDRDWDVFLWTIGSSEAPQNLTQDWGSRDEDPKFTPDGTILCKSDYDLIELDTTGSVLTRLTSDGADIEQSMPFATGDGTGVIYAQGAGESSDLYVIGRDGTGNTLVQGIEDVQEYYPVARDAETYLFTRWVSTSNLHDQVYLGYSDGAPAQSLPLNDSSSNESDAYPYGPDSIFLSSTRSGGAGGYDLYMAAIDSESVVSLSEWSPEINTPLNELGVAFSW